MTHSQKKLRGHVVAFREVTRENLESGTDPFQNFLIYF